MLMPPIEIGIIQLQQMSVIGLTKCPLHVMLADTDDVREVIISIIIDRTLRPLAILTIINL
jgi:hypothetical protein